MSIRDRHDTGVVIERMRRHRRRIVQRRRRGRVLAGVGAFTLALSAAAGVAGLTGTDLAGAATSRALGFMDLMERRSPGARTVAQLSKTRPVQQVLAAREPEAPFLPASFVPVLSPPVASLVPVDLGPPAIPPLTLFATPPASPFFVPPSGGGNSGCCGGGGGGGKGGGGGGTETTPPTIITITQPVPEPSTWMTMLLGFGLAGWLLRRERHGKEKFA